MKNKRRFTCLVLLCLVILMVGQAGCGQPPTTPPPQPPTDTPLPTDTPIPPDIPLPTEIDVADFALNEIIVTGPKNAIAEQLIVDPAALGLEFVTEVDLSYLASRSQEPADELPKFPINGKVQVERLFDSNQYGTLTMQLYRNVDDISTLLNKVENLNTDGNKLNIFADPNYMTDPLDSGSCNDPYSGGGSPYSGGGSPYSGGGSPYANLGFGMDVNSFRNQWAFKATSNVTGGISLPANPIIPESGSESVEYKGNGTTVGIFDTAPGTGTLSIDMADGTTFSLPVSNSIGKYYTAFSTPAAPRTPPTTTRVDVRDHGLFVSGLVKTVAPDSDIQLYRVLEDNGCGNLFVLAAAIHEFVSEKSQPTGTLERVVINLSLGVHMPDFEYYLLKEGEKLPPVIAALDTAIFEADRLQGVIVAAAGNDSAPPSANPALPAQRMQLPAFYSNVLGVAATNIDGKRSCFSNKGDVAAPGGNGGASTGTPAKPCVPRTDTATAAPLPCVSTNMSMCGYGVIGLSMASPSRYGLWSGTSFSTPLVSGLAALAFEKVGRNPLQVYCLIEHGAQKINPDPELGWGIINISQSLKLQNCP
jgi:hypothetical protein